MSPGVVQVRADICRTCPTPCAWRDRPEAHADPCTACPVGRWGRWGACTDSGSTADTPARGDVTPPAVAASPRGLGDAVAIVAAPIGHALGLDPARCGCNRRQDGLNAAVPFRPDADPGVVV